MAVSTRVEPLACLFCLITTKGSTRIDSCDVYM